MLPFLYLKETLITSQWGKEKLLRGILSPSVGKPLCASDFQVTSLWFAMLGEQQSHTQEIDQSQFVLQQGHWNRGGPGRPTFRRRFLKLVWCFVHDVYHARSPRWPGWLRTSFAGLLTTPRSNGLSYTLGAYRSVNQSLGWCLSTLVPSDDTLRVKYPRSYLYVAKLW